MCIRDRVFNGQRNARERPGGAGGNTRVGGFGLFQRQFGGHRDIGVQARVQRRDGVIMRGCQLHGGEFLRGQRLRGPGDRQV